MDINRPMTVDDEIAYNNYKLTADKILQLLSQIREDPSTSAKRWVWELLQNAKDVPNRFGKVSIEIELVSQDTLKFRHNGNPFTTKNITGLVQQVSSKDSQNLEGQTGKFGTGFICTHLLSDIIDVEGIVTYMGVNRRFCITLDRSGYRSENLLPRIESTLEDLRHIETSYEVVANYEDYRKENSFDTVFTYHLTTEEKRKSAIAGIEDLVNTLPVTLVTQSKKIKLVRVINRLKGTQTTYTCTTTPKGENVILSEIQIDNTTKRYLSYITSDVALTTEIDISKGGYEIIKRDSKHPVLYRDFPLIGSEKFHFPYTLNGFAFNPTERRNGIVLNSADHINHVANRAIVDKAVDAVLQFNDWLISNNATNRYLLASSRIPESQEKYSEDVAYPWITALQQNWRKQLLEQNLVETESGIEALKNLSVPSFVSTSTKETNEAFYNLLNGYYFGRGVLPKFSHLHGWLEVVRPEYESWGARLKYEKDDFLKDLSELGCIAELCSKTGKSRQDIICWLNKVYKFLIEQNKLVEFDNFAIIPNQNGRFKYLKELYSDHSARIPSVLKDIYNSVNYDYNAIQHILMDAEIEADVFGNTLRPFSLKEMIDKLNEYVKAGTNIVKNGTNIDVRSTVAHCILSLYPNTEEVTVLNKRKAIYNFCCAYKTMPAYSLVDTTEADLWKESDKYWFENSYKNIVNNMNVANVATNFFTTARTQEQALFWLDEYLKFYRDNSYGDFIKEQTIFPNQQLNLKKLNELRYDNNIPEPFKTLANIACYPSASKWCGECPNCESFDVYRHQLIHRSIHGYEQHNPLSVKDVYEYVKKRFDDSNDASKEIISRHTISILVRSDNNEPEEKKLYDFAGTLYGSSFGGTKYVESSTGFSWGFAQGFYITRIAKSIANSANLLGFKGLTTSFQEKELKELSCWIDDFIEFLHNFKNKKYWRIITDIDSGIGIWLNQKNEFCRFQDVRKDNDIPEELKDIAINRHVGRDVRSELFSLDSCQSSYLETVPMTISELGGFIDAKLAEYEGNKQDNDFRSLVFAIGKLCNKISGLEDSMTFFHESKNSLIVWSLGEGETLDLVGAIVQQGDEKIKVAKELLENNSLDELSDLVSNRDNIKGLSTRNKELEDENARLKQEIEELKSGRVAKVGSEESEMSKRKMYEAQIQAQRRLMEECDGWKYPEGYGEYNEDGVPYCYSCEEVIDESGETIKIVLKSYRTETEPFKVNPTEWEWVVKENAKLLVYRSDNKIVDVPKENLVKKQSTFSITFDSENLNVDEYEDRLNSFSSLLKYFNEMHFNFASFRIPGDAKPVKNIHAKTQGTQNQYPDSEAL